MQPRAKKITSNMATINTTRAAHPGVVASINTVSVNKRAHISNAEEVTELQRKKSRLDDDAKASTTSFEKAILASRSEIPKIEARIEERKKLEHRLRMNNLTAVDNDGDGDCFSKSLMVHMPEGFTADQYREIVYNALNFSLDRPN